MPDGQIARFYELETNKPLYLTRDDYELTYEDSNLPTHYSFKSKSKVEKLEERYNILAEGGTPKVSKSSLKTLRKDAAGILSQLDAEGRWVTNKDGRAVLDVSGLNPDELLLKSEVFTKNLSRLAEFVAAAKDAK